MSNYFPVTHSILSTQALAADVFPDYDLGKIIDVKLLKCGVNDTYVLKTHGSEKYIFRVYRTGWRSLSEIAYEVDVLIHLSNKDISIAKPLPDQEGGFIQTLFAPEGIRYAVLFTYAAGNDLTYEKEEEMNAFNYGKIAAKIHNAIQGFNCQHSRFTLDLDHLMYIPMKSIGQVLSHRKEDWAYLQALVERIRNQFETLPHSILDQGFCHGDFHEENAHVTDDGIVTCFDFDCCGWGWRAYDIAVFRWSARRRDKEKLWEPFLLGYTEERSLSFMDLQLVPLFIGIRHFWFLGLNISNGHDFGFGRINDKCFDRALKFFRDWDDEYLLGKNGVGIK